MILRNIENKVFFKKRAKSPKETEKIASQFYNKLNWGDVVAFYGDLGSGKTYFIKTLCKKLKTVEEAKSPSFTIINEYQTVNNSYIYHFDFYRIGNEAELLNLGLDDFFYNEYICLIEWADKIEKYLPENRWEIHLNFIKNAPEEREITIYNLNRNRP
jgi:tRNA threonylcarbamoyladenosine biosynthesis protein TsaE